MIFGNGYMCDVEGCFEAVEFSDPALINEWCIVGGKTSWEERDGVKIGEVEWNVCQNHYGQTVTLTEETARTHGFDEAIPNDVFYKNQLLKIGAGYVVNDPRRPEVEGEVKWEWGN